MNKIELIEAIQSELGCETKAEATRAYDAVVAVVGKQIQKGARSVKKPTKKDGPVKATTVLNIPGLGTFKVSASPARKARNPSNGEKVNVKAKRRLVFKAAANFKI